MNDTWDILQKELAYFNVTILDNGDCECVEDGERKSMSIEQRIAQYQEDINENVLILNSLWREATHLLFSTSASNLAADEKGIDLFIFSLKDMAKFLEIFEELDHSSLKQCIEKALLQDIVSYSHEQVHELPSYKMAIDWVNRLISHAKYMIHLLKFSLCGENHAVSIKIATGISGPWANLDLPMLERVFPWGDIDEEARGRDRDIRRQRRYRKGFEAYNNGGAVGEGHYWREIKNEPYSWYDRSTEEPYYKRYLLTRD